MPDFVLFPFYRKKPWGNGLAYYRGDNFLYIVCRCRRFVSDWVAVLSANKALHLRPLTPSAPSRQVSASYDRQL
jgi:hypothetical protein